MCTRLLTIALFAAHAYAAAGQTLTGVVVDPQGHVVADAAVRAVCADTPRAEVQTGPDGRFALTLAASHVDDCVLEVVPEGFEPLRLRVDERVDLGRLALRVAAVRETIEVRALLDVGSPSLGPDPMVFDAAQLRTTGADVIDWLRYVQSAAGGSAGSGEVLVDGMRSRTLPARAAIAGMDVSFDRFTVEFAEPDAARVDVVTRGPDRRFDVGASLSGLSRGGEHPLSQGQRASSRALSVGVSGAIPWTALTFLVEGRGGDRSSPAPVLVPAVPGVGAQVLPAATETSERSLSILAAWSRPGDLEFRASAHASTERVGDAGVGGLTLPEAAVSLRSEVHEVRVTLGKTGAARRYRAGLSVLAVESASAANSDAVGVRVSGSAVAGGAAETQATRSVEWTWKAVVEPRGPGTAWLVGSEASGSRFEIVEQPNRFGVLQFPSAQPHVAASQWDAGGVWFYRPGHVDAGAQTLQAGVFAQRDLWRSPSWLVRAGLRADLQRGDGVRVSPRLAAMIRLRGAVLRAGAGVFVRGYSSTLFAEAARSDPAHPLFAVAAASTALADRGGDTLGAARPITSEVDSAFRRSQDAVVSASLERRYGVLTSSVEYSFAGGDHVPGFRRMATALGWVDRLESAYRLRVHRVHARAELRRGAQSLMVNYQWTHSTDTGGGLFGSIDATDPASAPWVRTAGIPAHALQAAAALRLPGEVSLTMVGGASTGAPFDVTTGLDTGNLLFLDRGERGRNAGVGPAQRRLSLFVHRRFALPIFGEHGRQRPVAAGLQIDNVFGWPTYLTLGSVTGSPLFGRPLSALPGRSLRLSVTW